MSDLPADTVSLPPVAAHRPAAPTPGGTLSTQRFELERVASPGYQMKHSKRRWPWMLLGAVAGVTSGWWLLDRVVPASFDGRAVLEWTSDAPGTRDADGALVARLAQSEPVVVRALDRIVSGVMTADAPSSPRGLDARRAFAEEIRAEPIGNNRGVTLAASAADAWRARENAEAVAHSLAEYLASRGTVATTRPSDARLMEIDAEVASLRTTLVEAAGATGPPAVLRRDDQAAIESDLADVDARRQKFADALADAELDQSRRQASLVEHVTLLRRALDDLDQAIDQQTSTTAPSDQSTTLEAEYLDALRTYLSQVASGRTEDHPEVVRSKDRMARVDRLRGGAPARADTPLGRSRGLIEEGAKLRAGLSASEGHLASLRSTLDALALSREALRAERAALLQRRELSAQIAQLQQERTGLQSAQEQAKQAPPPFRVTPLDATPARRDPVRLASFLSGTTLLGAALGWLVSSLASVRLPRRARTDLTTLPDERLSALFGGAPVVAHLPRAVGPWDQVNPLSAGQTVEAISAVRAHVLQLRERGLATARVLGVVSPMPGAGVTGIVTSLGTLMARSQRLTACVDCNLLSPNLHEKMGLQLSPGWLDAVAGRSALRPTLQPTGDPHLFGFALGTASDDAAHDLVASQRRQQFMGQLASRFDTVLLDLPPLACGASSTVQLRGTDGILLVVTGQENAHSLALAADDLRKAGARVLGIVVNHR
jgi:Mrp family chromosome partitioning ATPase